MKPVIKMKLPKYVGQITSDVAARFAAAGVIGNARDMSARRRVAVSREMLHKSVRVVRGQSGQRFVYCDSAAPEDLGFKPLGWFRITDCDAETGAIELTPASPPAR